ncbi:MAG: SRPBCC domain-containing protein [Siphonobacter aquaeclarae]|nr:SRPBCC domain-containing protein [Siphonobacter aquaeclarae]
MKLDFVVTKEARTIDVTRTFAAPRQSVWAAWTQKELLDQWWAPRPWKAQTKEQHFAEGGQWLYAMVGPQGEEHWSQAVYKAIHPESSFGFSDGFCDRDGNIDENMPRMDWLLRFEDAGDETVVHIHIVHRSLEDLEKIIEMGFKEGFSMAMEGLDELLG